MAKKNNTRTFRKATKEERERIEKVDKQIQGELAEIKRQAEGVFIARETAVAAISKLREARLANGLSFGDVAQLSGISREAIHKIENDQHPNPTILTLIRYADALGLALDVSFSKKRKKRKTATRQTNPMVVVGESGKTSSPPESRSESA